jgi:hypothetical protein
MPSEAEILAVQSAWIKHLIEVLDSVTGRTAEQEAAFIKLKQEIAAVRSR